jgi:general secretion pathway protein L
MRDTIYIRFDRNWADELLWLRVGAEGPGAPETGSADTLAQYQGYRRVLLAPAESVLLAQVNIPARNRQRVIQALPFMLEDRLVQDVEQLHFAIGARGDDGALNVAVVERAHMDQWLERLRSAGVDPDVVIPETLTIPFEPDTWTLLVDGSVTLVRTGPQAGFAVDSDNAAALLAHALDEAGDTRPQRLIVYTEGGAGDPDVTTGIDIETEQRVIDGDSLMLMGRHVNEAASIDLLQGDYNRREQFGRLYRPWLASAAALAVLLVLYTGMLIHDHAALSREGEGLQQAIEQTFREAFPDVARIVNPRVQMERGLESLRGGGGDAGGFLDMLRATAPSLKEVDGIALQRLNYRDGRLDLALSIGNLQLLDRLKQSLGDNSGFEVEIQSATTAGDRVEARLQLRATP